MRSIDVVAGLLDVVAGLLDAVAGLLTVPPELFADAYLAGFLKK